MKKESSIFFAALLFFTRIPCPKGIRVGEEDVAQAAKYFPLIGWIVGGSSAIVYSACSPLVPSTISILIAMLCSILITGALHEDGLADVCDGFGGGWSKEKILCIMKDSHIGVYGVIGLIFLLLFKFYLLSALLQGTIAGEPNDFKNIFLLFLAAHSISRFTAITFMYTHEYGRASEESKSKNVSQKMSFGACVVAFLFGIAPLFLVGNGFIFLVIIPLAVAKGLLARYFNKWIGGYTGDCLGATQQICELVFYLFMLMMPWKSI